jgi:hypothetical protein
LEKGNLAGKIYFAKKVFPLLKVELSIKFSLFFHILSWKFVKSLINLKWSVL